MKNKFVFLIVIECSLACNHIIAQKWRVNGNQLLSNEKPAFLSGVNCLSFTS